MLWEEHMPRLECVPRSLSGSMGMIWDLDDGKCVSPTEVKHKNLLTLCNLSSFQCNCQCKKGQRDANLGFTHSSSAEVNLQHSCLFQEVEAGFAKQVWLVVTSVSSTAQTWSRKVCLCISSCPKGNEKVGLFRRWRRRRRAPSRCG